MNVSSVKLSYVSSLMRRFARDEQGSMTVWGLFIWFVSGILGAFALDVTHLMSSRTHLQVAADQAAHAAIYQRHLMDEDTETVNSVKDEALALVSATLPSGRYGITMDRDDIEFGTFNLSTRTFTADAASKQAVRATARFSRARNNAAITFLFRLLGRDDFDIAAQAVYVAELKHCLNQGYIANGIVDIQSNNEFSNQFCIHSNEHVSVNQNNTYDPGTIVSMPDKNLLDLPGIEYNEDGTIKEDSDAWDRNVGLYEALRNHSIDIDRVTDRMENMMHEYLGDNSPWQNMPNPGVEFDTPMGFPDYIWDYASFRDPIVMTNVKSITTEEILSGGITDAITESVEVVADDGTVSTVEQEVEPANTTGTNRVYYIDCQGNSGLTIDASTTPLNDVIIMTPCEIKFSKNSQVHRARIVTTADSADSISSPSDLVLGGSNACNTGGAQLFTMGGIRFPSGLEVNGSQLMAMGDIQFAANANGLTGASFMANGRIDGTSNGRMSLCNSWIPDTFEISYFRLVL